jgi:hypothetical protein
MSDDIDLFTRTDIDKDEIFYFLNRNYTGKYQINNIQNIILQISIDDIKVDIYYLLQEISLMEMFDYYKQKYNQNDIATIKRSLIYFDDVTDSNWSSVKLLTGKLSVEKIKHTIVNEMNKYNKKGHAAPNEIVEFLFWVTYMVTVTTCVQCPGKSKIALKNDNHQHPLPILFLRLIPVFCFFLLSSAHLKIRRKSVC